jgi:hypothetical protein
MPQLIEVPGAGVIEFPDGMDDAAITAAIENEIIPQVAKENDTGFWGAMKGGGYSSLASVNRAGQAVSQMLGYEGGEEYFDKNAQYYQQEAARADPYRDPILEADSFGQGVEGVVEGVAGSIPQLGASLAAGATGAAIGTAIAPGVGTIIGGLGGVLLASQPSLFGENAQEQIEQYGEIRDPWLAFGTSWPQALAETVIAAATFGVGKIAGGMISRGVKSAFLGTGIEGTTELAQTAATIAQAGGDITTPENRMRLAEAAIVGGALGGSVGGVTGAVLGPRSTKADPETGLIDPATLEQADRENVLFDMANDPEVAEVLRANGIDPAAEGFAQSDAAQSFLDRIIERRNREAARSMDADGGAQSARQAAAPVSEQIRTLIEEDAFADAELAASRDAGEAALTADVDAMRQERDRLAERGVNVENPALPVNRRIKRAEENLESYKRGRNEKAPGYRRMSPLFAQGLGQLDDPSYREPLANRQEIESEEQAAAGLPNRQNKQGFDYTGVNRSLGAKRVEFPPEYAAIEREAQQAQQAQAREERRAQAAAGRPAPIASPPGVPPRAQPPLPEQPRRTAQDEFAEWNEISRKLYENGAVVGADGMPMNFTPEQLTGLDPKEALALHAALGRRGRREGQSAVERRFPELFSEQAAQSRPGFTQRNIRDRTGQAGTNYQGAQRGLAFERPAQGATSTETPTSIPSRRPIEVDDAVTSDGTRVPVEYAVVELDDLTPSQTDDGRVNPAYPSDMQPRDRSRGMSQQQVNRIARQLDPRLLDRSPKAGDGAPIVAADGVVESGNGRVLALRQAYRDGGAAAQRYRDYLTAQGYPVEGLARPTLVRIRTNDMTPGARRAFTREANERDNLSMSTTEQAMADASAMTDGLMLMHRGGDADSAGNRDYVRAFIRDVVGANDQAGMIDREGAMSQTAKRRIESALLARAYGSADLVAATTESADSNIRAIGGALVDVAGDWARMRTDARTNQIDPKMDQTDALSEAVRVVQRARREGREVSEYVNQTDMLTGRGVSPMAETFLRLMFRNPQRWTQPVGRNKLADALRYYTEEAGKTSPGADMFGETTATTPEKVAANAQRLVNDGLFDVAGRGQGDLLENPIGDDPNNPQAQATEQAPGQDAIYQAERQAGDIREQRAIDREDAAFINAERQASQDQSPLRPRDVDEDIPFGMGDPVAPRTELAPGQDTVGPEGLRLIHGTTREELTLDDVQIVREGAKQSKRGRKTGGFYASSVNDTAHAETYAAMAGGRGKLLDVIVAPGTRVLRFDGDVTRLSEGQINAWTEQGYGLVIGKDMRGRTEHAIIDKNAIQSLGPTTSARTEATPQGEQRLMEGVAPVADTDRIAAGRNAPMRGGNAPVNDGLFDVAGRGQGDLLENPIGDDPNNPQWQATEQAPGQAVEQTTGFRDVGRGERTSQKIDNGVYGTVRPELTEDGKKAAKAALKILKRIAPRANSQLFENLIDENGNVKGFGVYLNNVINLALDNPDIEGTARHEAIHFLKETGAITPKQWEALVNTARRNNWVEEFDIVARYEKIKEKLTPEQVIEESIAEAYTAWANGDLKLAPQGNAVMRALQRIFERVRGAVREALGYDPDYKDIFSRVESGKADRGPRVRNVSGAEAARGMRFQPAGNPISAAFKRWFGGSKVVDADGKPLVVYHGTNSDFEAFDPERAIGSQFWFTNDRSAIEKGEVGAQGRGVILDVYLSIKNPAGWKEYDKWGVDELIREGYDGMALPDSDGTVTYVAFDPTQIKSATGNTGNYDPNDPRVNYQAPGLSETPAELAEARPDAVRLFQSSAPARNRANDISQNPVFRPTTWQRLWGSPIKDVAQAGKNLMSGVDSLVNAQSDRGVMNRMSDLPRMLFLSNIASIESVRAAYKDNAQAQTQLNKILKTLGSRAGSGEYRPQGYEEGVDLRYGMFSNDLLNALGPAAEDEGRMKNIRQILQGTATGTAENRAPAKRVRKVLDDIHGYMKAQGLDVGYAGPNYFTRMIDREIVMDQREKFIDRATQVYQQDQKLNAEDARIAANAWFRNITMGRSLIGNVGGGIASGTNITKERVFKTDAPERLLSDFYEQDPRIALREYTLQAARRGEYAKRFYRNGKDILPEMMGDLQKTGLDGSAYRLVENAVLASLGRNDYSGDIGTTAASWLQTIGTLTLLPRATLTSLAEPATVAARTGRGGDAFSAFGLTLKEVFSQIRGNKTKDRHFAEAMGIVSSALNDMILQSRFGGAVESKFQQNLTANYFRKIGLHDYTMASRVAATKLGRGYIKSIFDDLDTHPTTAQEILNDLGISAEDVPAMRDWLNQNNGLPDENTILNSGELGEKYQAALTRFARETIQAPTAAERPRFATHPIGRMIYGLTSFLYGFGRNIVGRAARMSARGLNPRSDLTKTERVQNLMPIAGIAAMVALHTAVSEMREALFNSEKSSERTMGEKAMLGVSRSGVLGPADLVLNAVTGLKYQRDLANLAVGPGPGFFLQQFQDILGLYTHNSENTNTAERNALKGAYGLTVMPALTVMLGLLPPQMGLIPAGLAAFGVAQGTSPSAREWAADVIIGKSDAD